jgi:hypothetical protein
MRDRIWINAHQAGPDALRLAASLGVGGGRFDGNWYDLQQGPDKWTYQWLDDLLATCKSLGLEAYVSIGYTPPWLNPDRSALPPLYDWQRFCLSFAQHFKGRLTYVGCWNEWAGSSKDYVDRLLRPMAEAFRSTDSQYRICAPDLETERDWPTRLTDVIRYGADCIDILTVHCYQSTGADVWSALTERCPPRPHWLPVWFPWWTPSIQQVIEAAGWRGPTWLTETGWRSDLVGEEGQAQRFDQLFERLQGASWPAGVVVFQLMDEPTGAGGVFRQDGSIKPAGAVIQRYANRGIV